MATAKRSGRGFGHVLTALAYCTHRPILPIQVEAELIPADNLAGRSDPYLTTIFAQRCKLQASPATSERCFKKNRGTTPCKPMDGQKQDESLQSQQIIRSPSSCIP
jgi:hypothetical protein